MQNHQLNVFKLPVIKVGEACLLRHADIFEGAESVVSAAAMCSVKINRFLHLVRFPGFQSPWSEVSPGRLFKLSTSVTNRV